MIRLSGMCRSNASTRVDHSELRGRLHHGVYLRVHRDALMDDYDKTREWETRDEQARWDEAQDNAANERADRYDEHREDVP